MRKFAHILHEYSTFEIVDEHQFILADITLLDSGKLSMSLWDHAGVARSINPEELVCFVQEALRLLAEERDSSEL